MTFVEFMEQNLFGKSTTNLVFNFNLNEGISTDRLLILNPYNAEATFIQSRSMQRSSKTI